MGAWCALHTADLHPRLNALWEHEKCLNTVYKKRNQRIKEIMLESRSSLRHISQFFLLYREWMECTNNFWYDSVYRICSPGTLQVGSSEYQMLLQQNITRCKCWCTKNITRCKCCCIKNITRCKCCTKIPSCPNFLVSPQLLFRAAIQFSTLLRPKHKQRIFVANIKPGFWHICHKQRIWVAFQIYFVIVCLSPLCSSVQTELSWVQLSFISLEKVHLATWLCCIKLVKKCINVYFNKYVFLNKQIYF